VPFVEKAFSKENRIGDLLNLLDAILDAGELYKRYGLKGCLLIVLAIVALIAVVVLLATWLG